MNKKDHTTKAKSLRKKAEAKIKKMHVQELDAENSGNIRLLHELHVHEIELEMQNEELKAAQREAELAAKKYRDLYDLAPSGYITLDKSGAILEINKNALSLLNLEYQPALTSRLNDFFGAAARIDFQAFLNDVFAQKNGASFQGHLLPKGGTAIDVQITGVVSNDQRQCLITIIDITQQKHAAELVAASEMKFRRLFESAKDGILLLDAESGQVLEINSALIEMLGYSKDADAGRTIEAAEFWNAILPQSFDITEIVENEYIRLDDVQLKTKSGMQISVELTGNVYAAGRKKIVQCHFRDITSRKIADDLLREREERFRSVAETAHDAIITTNAEGIVYSWNLGAEKIFGYSAREMQGQFLHLIIPHEQRSRHGEGMQRIQNGEAAQIIGKTLEMEGLHKSGTVFPVELSLAQWQSGGTIYYTGIIRDITERKAAEAELIKEKKRAEELSKVKSNFLASMSHELRTPLIGILGYSEILADVLENKEHKRMLRTINESGERLKKTLNMILDLSKVEAEQLHPVMGHCNLKALVQQSIELFQAVAEQKGLYMRTRFPDSQIAINVDKRLFSDLLNNLIKNAIVYTDTGGITVSVEEIRMEGKPWAGIKVEDTGIGIHEKDFALIFEEFRQVSEGLDRGFEGTGLGLTLVKKYVELMNGIITVESQLTVGSVFTVLFPLVEPDITGLADLRYVDHAGKISIRQFENLPVILYVDNDETSQMVVERMLRGICSVEFASSGIEALAKATTKIYDCFFMDINLGRGIDGKAVTMELRKMTQYAFTPIVAVTAFAMVGDREEFIACGCTDYISKPFGRQDLLNLVATIMNKL